MYNNVLEVTMNDRVYACIFTVSDYVSYIHETTTKNDFQKIMSLVIRINLQMDQQDWLAQAAFAQVAEVVVLLLAALAA